MSNRARNNSGTYTDKLTEQDVLKAFDYETTAEAPMLTASEITDAVAEHFDIEVSSETVRRRLREWKTANWLQVRNSARRLWAGPHSLGRHSPTTC